MKRSMSLGERTALTYAFLDAVRDTKHGDAVYGAYATGDELVVWVRSEVEMIGGSFAGIPVRSAVIENPLVEEINEGHPRIEDRSG